MPPGVLASTPIYAGCVLTAPVQADEHASVLESLRDLRIIHSLV
jgi:hypothetical protein